MIKRLVITFFAMGFALLVGLMMANLIAVHGQSIDDPLYSHMMGNVARIATALGVLVVGALAWVASGAKDRSFKGEKPEVEQ